MMQELIAGTKVLYKKNGTYGSYEATVISVGKRIRIRVQSWCGQPLDKEYEANVSVRRIRTTTPAL